jgi:poly(A) polymerase
MISSKTCIDARTLGIGARQLSPGARFVIDTLQQHGHLAYVVGGGVRDLLAGFTPKDFDIATDAHPEPIKAIFKQRCQLIGRRFRLAHVRFQREIIEVSTFRAAPTEEQSTTTISPHGLVTRDNTFGDLEGDALRRDFTVNALYYDPNADQVIDFFNGLTDIQQKQLRIIGDPALRYQQDPVRLLRAVRLASKLNFQWIDGSSELITQLGPLLTHIPAPRLFDEWLKLFLSGYAQITLKALQSTQLLTYLLPMTAQLWQQAEHQALIIKAAQDTDTRLSIGKSVTPAFLFAAFLWHPVQQQLKSGQLTPTDPSMPFNLALQQAADRVLAQQLSVLSIPKRFTQPMREIWELQYRLDHRHGQRAFRLLAHPRFRAAYDFLLLREFSQEIPTGLGQWWTEFQSGDAEHQQLLITALGKNTRPAKKPRRKRRDPL